MRLLVVEDDPELGPALRAQLARAGYAVDLADNGVDGGHLGATEPYDGVVLDLGLPDRPGLAVLRDWRAAGNPVPVLILTARDGWSERVEGLQAGADDYLGKPFHPEELLARVQALLRRAATAREPQLRVGHWRLDEARQRLVADDVTGTPAGSAGEPATDGATDEATGAATGRITRRDTDAAAGGAGAPPREQPLTATEFRLLRYFMRHPDQILSKTRLAAHIYDYDAERDSNVIEVYVGRLRALLGADRIQTRRGQGYLFRSGG